MPSNLRRLRFGAALAAVAAIVTGCADGAIVLDVGGTARTYRLHVPAGLGGAPAPLVIALHGFTSTGRAMARLTGFNAVAEREGFVAAYPDGIRRAWNSTGLRGVDDVAFLEALIDDVGTRTAIDPARVYVTGASAGGMMAQYFACRSDRVAAIAPVMGSLVEGVAASQRPPRPVPVLLIHGVDDRIVPYGGGPVEGPPGPPPVFLSARANAAWWAEENGCGETPVIDTLPNTGGRVERSVFPCADVEVILLSIGGAGHTWPGHPVPFTTWILGPTSSDLDATEAIWAFFARHRRAG